ncbi:MAG: flagellar motor protein MotB [Oscillospiraceae bacterium]|nr:flagellar motor protein MotB [Oscillospiraceae bacterium]
MARKKQAAAGENTEGWLTTYADLISLLLCFFVLMYAASTPDEAKMQWILQSMTQISGTYVNVVKVDDPVADSDNDVNDFAAPDLPSDPEGAPGIPGHLPMTFDDLFNWVSDAIADSGMEASVSTQMAAGRLYIRFDSEIMFAPDSYELLPGGIRALNVIAPGIKAIGDYIKLVEVVGHTADAPGSVSMVNDWTLSSMRAVSVTSYLDWGLPPHIGRMVDSEKYEPIGKAQYDPYYPNDTEEGRAKNRRVELVIIRNDFDLNDTEIITDILKYDYDLGPLPGSMDDGREAPPGIYDRIAQIESNIRDKYNVDDILESSPGGNEFGIAPGGVTTITPDMLINDE